MIAPKEDRVPWWVIARRLVPFVLVTCLLWVCWALIVVGYGKREAADFLKRNR